MITTALIKTIPFALTKRPVPLEEYLPTLETTYRIKTHQDPTKKALVSFSGPNENIIKLLTTEFKIPEYETEDFIAKEYNGRPEYLDAVIFTEMLVNAGWKKVHSIVSGLYPADNKPMITYTKDISGEEYEIRLVLSTMGPNVWIRKKVNDDMVPVTRMLHYVETAGERLHKLLDFCDALEKD